MNSTKEIKEPAKKKRFWPAIKSLAMLVLAFMLIFNTYQLLNLGMIVTKVDKYNQGVVDEIGAMNGDVKAFAADLTEIREYLLLPTKEYSFGEKATEGNIDEKPASETELGVYAFLNSLDKENAISKNKTIALSLVDKFKVDPTMKEYADSEVRRTIQGALSLGDVKAENSTLSIKFLSGTEEKEPLFNVLLNFETGSSTIQSIAGIKNLKSFTDSGFLTELLGHLVDSVDHVSKLKKSYKNRLQEIADLVKDDEIKKILADKKVQWPANPEENAESYIFKVGQDGIPILNIRKSDMHLMVGEQNFENATAMKPALIRAFNSIESASPEQKLTTERLNELTAIFQQPAFQDLLTKSGGKLSEQPRQETNKIIYDVTGPDSKVKFSFAIEITSGMVKILKDDQEIAVTSFLDDGSKKKP